MAEPTPALPPPETASQPWARTVLWVSIMFILVAGVVVAFKSCMALPQQVIQQTSNALATVASAFGRGTVTTSFISYATTLTNHLRLQVATLEQMELFTRTEAPLTGYGYIPLPDVIVEARAPVQYTYYVDLKSQWRLVLTDHQVEVHAPSIRFNKPAVDVSEISYEVKKGLLKTDVALENLKRSVSSLVLLRARANLHLVRETARRQVSEFVQTWLLRTYADGERYSVTVYFADEASPSNTLSRQRQFQ